MNWIRYVAGALLTVFAGASFALVPADIPGVPKDLRVGPPEAVKQMLARKQPLAVAPTPTITPDQLFNWAEAGWPDYFPKGPTSSALTYDYQGTTYTFTAVRAYSTGNYVGATADGTVYGLGPVWTGGVLMSLGKLSDYACQVIACGTAVGKPGAYKVEKAFHQFLVNYNTEGKMEWLYDPVAKKSIALAAADIAATRWNSNRRGWGTGSQAATPPQANGDLQVLNVCASDRGLPTVIDKDGKEYWAGFSADGYQLVGDERKPRMVLGMIQYGNYEQATVYTVREADNTVTLVVDFTTNCVFGFGRDDKLVALDPMKPLLFIWNSDKAGASRKPGWGLGGTAPSVRQAYFEEAEAKAGRLVVKFRNMACTDAGGITAYTAESISDDGKVITYNPGTDRFGAGWFVVPKPDDANPIWQAGSGVAMNAQKFQVTWDQALCLEK